MPALQTVAGLGATLFGMPSVGLPLAATGASGLFGAQQGQGNPSTPSSGALNQAVSSIAPATQEIFNAMGLNPTQRAQTGGGTQTPPTPPMSTSRAFPQGLGIPQPQAPIQSAGQAVSAGSGAMAQNPMMNPQLQQILAMFGRPY